MDNHTTEDPYENLARRYEWREAVRRVRFGPRSKTREIALIMSDYGNSDGRSYFPGIARLAAVAECSERTARDALATLRELGLLRRVEEGSRHGRPKAGHKPHKDHYVLAIPPDLADRVDMLPEDELDPGREQKRIAERRADNDRRKEKRRAAAVALRAQAGSPEGPPKSREDPAYQGKVAAYQGKPNAVTGESYGRNRGKLQPDIRDATSEDSPYPSIGPTHRPTHTHDHPAPMQARAIASALAADEDDFDAVYEAVAAALGDDLDIAEESCVRGMLAKGEHPMRVMNKILKDRREVA